MRCISVDLDHHHQPLINDNEIGLDSLIRCSPLNEYGQRRDWDCQLLERIIQENLGPGTKQQAIFLQRCDVVTPDSALVIDILSL
jgi:hypothetical protein